MKTKLSIIFSMLMAAMIFTAWAIAGEDHKMVIELKTDDFEIAETDISDLAVGESETIVTDSGKVIDLLRTAEGVEIYVDGELLELPEMDAHGAHHGTDGKMHKRIIIECEVDDESGEDAECGEDLMFISGDDVDLETLHADGKAHKVIVKKLHSECVSDEEGDCEDHRVWVSGDEDMEFGELHEAGEGHKVIRIHRSHDGDVDVETEVEKIIIRKD